MSRSIVTRISSVVLWSLAAVLVFWVCLWIWGAWHDEWSGYNASVTVSDGYCTIAVVPIVGDIVPYAGAYEDGSGSSVPSTNPDDFLTALRAAEADPNILGVLVRIDSGGGSPVASEIIANGLKSSSVPIIALIREIGASGAYLAATGAQTIIASPFSDVGSIGVTMSYLDNSKKNQEDGIQYISLTSAKFKDYGNPDKPLTGDERALIERDLKMYHEQFVKEVAENRNLSIEEVAQLADGSSMPGTLALEHKLIDALGDQETARVWFAEQLEMSVGEVSFCQ